MSPEAKLFRKRSVNINEQEVHPDRDTRLMLEFQRGKADSFDILFKKYSVSLINFGYRFLGSRAKAEEVAQEVLLRVYTARDSYSPRAKFSTWVFKIARNLCLNELRRQEYRKHHVSLDNQDRDRPERQTLLSGERVPTPEENMEARVFEEAFNRAVGGLPARQRAAFVLNRFNNASYKEVASVLGCSEPTVKSLIHRATVTLKDYLKEYIKKGTVPDLKR
jgi:RNA polymerase sigma-70 factor (ECF subfamily)